MLISDIQLINDLKASKYYPVYLLSGEEDYYIDKVSDYFEHNVIDQDNKDFNQTILYANDTDMSTVLSYAKQYPVISPIRLLLVKEAQAFEPKEWEQLSNYLKNPMSQTLLVLCYRHKNFDKRSKVYKEINEKGCICEKAKIRDNELPDWIGTFANQNGYNVTLKGAMLIAECLGNHLDKIANEMSKIFINIKPGESIDENIIEQYIGISKDYNIFELQKAIGSRNALQCNRIINHFAANPKENPIQKILPILYSFFIKIMIYHQLPDKKKASSALGVNPYFIRDYETAANNYSLGKLASCIGYLYDTDLRSKGLHNSGTVSDGELLKELIFKVIH